MSWVIPEDGIVDDVAVDIAATGARLVNLTPTERKLAVRRILAKPGTNAATIAERLGVSMPVAKRLVWRAHRAQAAGI